MKVYNLLNKHQKWTKGTEARDNKGESCSPDNEKAARFCASGALSRCYPKGYFKNLAKVQKTLQKMTNGQYTDIVMFNDSPETTYQDVVSVFRKANV